MCGFVGVQRYLHGCHIEILLPHCPVLDGKESIVSCLLITTGIVVDVPVVGTKEK